MAKTAATPQRRSARKSKSTPKKKQAEASKISSTESPKGAADMIMFETPPKKMKKDVDADPIDKIGLKPRSIFESDADEKAFMSSDDDIVMKHVLRNLSETELEPSAGRIYFVCKGIDFFLSDDIESVTNAAVLWFNLTDTDESIVDSDDVYVSSADNLTLAMEEIKARGALNMVTDVNRFEDIEIPSPGPTSPAQLRRDSAYEPHSKFARSPSNIAPAIRITSSSSPISVKKECELKASGSTVGSTGGITAKPKSSKAALVTPNPYAKAAGKLAQQGKAKKKSKFDLKNATVDISMVQEMVEQQAKRQQELSDGGPNHFFFVSCSGVHIKDGRVGATGTFDLVNATNKPYWQYKPAAIPVAFNAACFSVDELAHLRQVSETLHTVVCRRHPHGKNSPKKTTPNSQGRTYNVETIAFYVDLTPFVKGVSFKDMESVAEAKLVEILGDLHQVFVSNLFKQALEKSMQSNPRTERFYTNTVCKGTNKEDFMVTIRNSKLKVDMPAPLSTHLMDDDIMAAMQMLTGTNDTSLWTDAEREMAFEGGNLPEEWEGDDGEIILE